MLERNHAYIDFAYPAPCRGPPLVHSGAGVAKRPRSRSCDTNQGSRNETVGPHYPCRLGRYAKSLATGYVRTAGDGRTENSEQSMATLRSGDPKIVAMIPEDLEVRLYGDTAILTGSLILTTRQQNRVRERHSRLTEVFIRRSGFWFLAATQITFLAK